MCTRVRRLMHAVFGNEWLVGCIASFFSYREVVLFCRSNRVSRAVCQKPQFLELLADRKAELRFSAEQLGFQIHPPPSWSVVGKTFRAWCSLLAPVVQRRPRYHWLPVTKLIQCLELKAPLPWRLLATPAIAEFGRRVLRVCDLQLKPDSANYWKCAVLVNREAYFEMRCNDFLDHHHPLKTRELCDLCRELMRTPGYWHD